MSEYRYSYPIDFDWVEIAGGVFYMGSDPIMSTLTAFRGDEDEHPQHQVHLQRFFISATPITNEQYLKFVCATGHRRPGDWVNGVPHANKMKHPVTYVDWHDAQAFAEWCGANLPSEAQWEKSARGDRGAIFPWGDNLPGEGFSNFNNIVGDTSPVSNHPLGASQYGVEDLAGNVWEWTSSLYKPYPYKKEDGRENKSASEKRVVRGGNYLSSARNIRCADRDSFYPGAKDVYLGFRIAAEKIGDNTKEREIGITWKEVPEGSFLMGTNHDKSETHHDLGVSFPNSHHKKNLAADFDNEIPTHKIRLGNFSISRNPITNMQYQIFIQETGYPAPSHWPGDRMSEEISNHPVVYVDWYDALAFCEWAHVALPTEAQWERAARFTDMRIWPWGNTPPNNEYANFGQISKTGRTTPVGKYPQGASAEGVLDLAGNVWEMVSSAYRPYPYESQDGREVLSNSEQFVLRGGSFFSPHPRYLRSTVRSMSYKERKRDHIGFRVVNQVLRAERA